MIVKKGLIHQKKITIDFKVNFKKIQLKQKLFYFLTFFLDKIVKYKIEVTTSNKSYAGTDANVFIKIYGQNTSTDRLLLTKSKTSKNPFEQGKTDVFTFELPNLGDIKKIK